MYNLLNLPDEMFIEIFSYLVSWKHRLVCKLFYDLDVRMEPYRMKIMWFKYSGMAEKADITEHINYIIKNNVWCKITNEYLLEQKLNGIDVFIVIKKILNTKYVKYENDFNELSIDNIKEKYKYPHDLVKKLIKSLKIFDLDKLTMLTNEDYIIKKSVKYENTSLLKIILFKLKDKLTTYNNKTLIITDDIKNKYKMTDKMYNFCNETLKYELCSLYLY